MRPDRTACWPPARPLHLSSSVYKQINSAETLVMRSLPSDSFTMYAYLSSVSVHKTKDLENKLIQLQKTLATNLKFCV